MFTKKTILITFAALFLQGAISCSRVVVTTPDVQAVSAERITLDPNDKVWDAAPLHSSKLILQDLVDPRLMEASTQEVLVKAITSGGEIAFRLEWADASQNDLPGPREFVDAAAVQLPAKIEASVPAPQMGEAGKNVEISYWRADWQAIVDGRADEIAALHPNATVDHYPFRAKPLENDPNAKASAEMRYAPARKLGNNRSGPRENPVEDLIAAGPGTLSPGPNAWSKGKGVRTKNGWAIVLTRPIPEGFSQASPTQVAFAVWEGTHREAGARKMRTGWVQMLQK
jgi:DMSO reductase family type II enzyme heme b subunit